MNKKEAAQVLAILHSSYPNFYKTLTEETAQGVVSVWSLQFSDISADIVLMAINKLISTSKYPPTIAEIKEKLSGLYWEAFEKLYIPLGLNGGLTEEESALYHRIYNETERYKNPDRIEPTISEIFGEARALTEREAETQRKKQTKALEN